MAWVELAAGLADFRSPDNKHGRIKVFEGSVAGNTIWSETHVSSSGGGGSGYVHPEFGGNITVSAPTIYSHVNEKREFFVVDAGIEQSYTLTNVNFPIRAGHVVSMVEITIADATTLLGAENRTTGQKVTFGIPYWAVDRLSDTKMVTSRKLASAIIPRFERLNFGGAVAGMSLMAFFMTGILWVGGVTGPLEYLISFLKIYTVLCLVGAGVLAFSKIKARRLTKAVARHVDQLWAGLDSKHNLA